MLTFNRSMPVACILVAAGFLGPVTTSTPDVIAPRAITPPLAVLYAAPGDLNYASGPTGAALQALIAGDRPATATITVTYNGFPAEAQTAFQAAVNIWATFIASSVPIRIVANWTDLGPGVLGSARATAGCVTSHSMWTLYVAALADKIMGRAFCAAREGQTSEIIANVNSGFADWEFGTSGVGVPGKYNFMTVVLHEVGHGLGFFGAFTSSNGIGDLPLPRPTSYIYDAGARIGGGWYLDAIPRPSAALHAQLTSNNTFWNTSSGPKLETHDMTAQYGLASDHGWLEGSSYLHLDDVRYSGTPDGLMTFALNSNEVYTDVGPVVRTLFAAIGWTRATRPATLGDFDGDDRADFAVFRPATGMWFVQGQADTPFGRPGDIPVPGDYDGDQRMEIAVFRAGDWITPSGQRPSPGDPGDIPVPGDYDGDFDTDFAVFSTAASIFTNAPDGVGQWRIGSDTIPARLLGRRGDIPVPADYDGDYKTDIAVFRPSTGMWYVTNSSTGLTTSFQFGQTGDVPVPALFDTDGQADFAVFRPSTGTWHLSMTIAGSVSIPFGLTGDVPMAQDTDGDRVAELTVWRPASGTWFTYNRVTGATASVQHGSVGDIPAMQRPRVPSAPSADFDGDGRAELTIFRETGGYASWYQRFSATDYATAAITDWGLAGDIKVPGDFDGDRKTDIAVFRPANGVWYIVQSASGTVLQVQWGLASDVPVPADYDGDGRTDPAIYRILEGRGYWFLLLSSSDYTRYWIEEWGRPGDVPRPLDLDGNGRADFVVFRQVDGVWGVWDLTLYPGSLGGTIHRIDPIPFGLATDLPVAQDFDGDGATDLGLFRPSTGQWFARARHHSIPIGQQFGLAGDTPAAHDYDGDGVADLAIFRPSTGQWFIRQSSDGVVQIHPWGLSGDQPALRVGRRR